MEFLHLEKIAGFLSAALDRWPYILGFIVIMMIAAQMDRLAQSIKKWKEEQRETQRMVEDAGEQ